MKAIGIACQTITWGDGQTEFMDRVVRVAAAAGYSALEIGYRRLAGVDAGELGDLLSQSGLAVKDFASLERGVDTVCLGDGVVPLAEIAEWIRSDESHVEWVIAEQDKAQGCPDDAITRNGQYLNRLFQTR